MRLNRTVYSFSYRFQKQITRIIQSVYPVFNITNQASKRERNDHGRPILKVIHKLHKLYRVFIQYLMLLTIHQAFGTHVRGFKPGRSRRIFQRKKILSTPSFGREVEPFVPCRIFAAFKRTRK